MNILPAVPPCRSTAHRLIALLVIAPTLFAASMISHTHAAAPKLNSGHYDRGILPEQSARLSAMKNHSPPGSLFDGLIWLSGQPTRPADLRGKVVVIQFWKIGDPSAQSWHQRIAASQQQFGADDLQVITVHPPADRNAVEKFLARQRFGVTTALDAAGELSGFFSGGDRAINIVIDRQGAVRHFGLNGRGIDVAIAELIAEPFDADTQAPEEFDAGAAAGPTVVDANEPAQAPAPADADGFPPYSNVVTTARDIRGRQSPPVYAQTWLTDKPNFLGKVVVVDFWATWCGPCIASIPHTNALADKFRDSVVIVGLSNEGAGDIRQFMRNREMRYSIATDPMGRMQAAVGVRGIPHMMVVSPDGIVRFQGHPNQLTEALLRQIVEASARQRG